MSDGNIWTQRTPADATAFQTSSNGEDWQEIIVKDGQFYTAKQYAALFGGEALRDAIATAEIQRLERNQKRDELHGEGRYRYKACSVSGHCCFQYTVIDTETNVSLCECWDEEQAKSICATMNQEPSR